MKISILGDSISTFAGITTPMGVFYDEATCERAGIRSAEDTWWMQVIRAMGGTLEVNNSCAGTTVCGRQAMAGCSDFRTAGLGSPDVILVWMGLNDAAFGLPLDRFETAYRQMLQKLRYHNPGAEIWCGTFCPGRPTDPDEPLFFSLFNAETAIPFDTYSLLIRELAAECGCRAADLWAPRQEYDAMDGVHPDRNGMKTIAELWLAGMKEAKA